MNYWSNAINRKFLLVSSLCVFLFSLLSAPQLLASTLPPEFRETLITGGITRPTAMAFAPDGRLFVAEQDGNLRVIKNGALLSTPFLQAAVNTENERGLLGVAFDPNFVTNQYVYVYYTTASYPTHNRVSRFTADGDVAVSNSELPLLDLDNLVAGNHNGGAIHFGQDGKLYVGVGENTVGSNSQTLANLLGKILRINKDGSIPTDNPFYNQASGDNRAIWALGLRNPFTFAFQPGTGRMFINDVGEQTWEEINDGIAGSNYGWPDTEGETSDPDFESPLFAYNHSGVNDQSGCAISGGAFYNPAEIQFPSKYVGDYFFGDFCNDWIRNYDLTTDTAETFATSTSGSLVDIQISSDGSLYYLARGTGVGVYRIEYPGCDLGPDPSPDGAAPKREYFTSSPVTLTWNRTSWAQGYEIQVDNKTSFSSLDYHDDAVPAGTLSVTINDLNECNYYWRVRAKIDDTHWGSWTTAQQFVLDLP